MTSGDCELMVDRGGVFEIAFRLRDENRAVIDLTGAVASFSIAATYGEVPVVEVTSEDDQVEIDLETGIVTVNLTSLDTAELVAESYVFYFETEVASDVRRWARGVVLMKA